ncbi:aldo/keto reductase [Streptomyces sp. CA-142005]|uniref:aldo/keto reductase n=1 Tax=Streptomyces sp. CA-142005 TaxID=3240052 RepID=UPI003D8C1C9C
MRTSGEPEAPTCTGSPRLSQRGNRSQPRRSWPLKVREVADRIGGSAAQVALGRLVAQGEHVVPIPGTKTPKYLVDNAAGADVRLSAADLADLDAIPAPVGARY